MIYQQTTQVPNIVFDTHLPLLTESELKVLLIIIRQTNGWIDKRTGGRKTRDRISQMQFVRKTGLCRRVISKSMKSLIDKGLVTATCQNGDNLQCATSRKGVGRMYYAFQGEPPHPQSIPLRMYGVRHIGEVLQSSGYHSIDPSH